jgi:hypothetical protein
VVITAFGVLSVATSPWLFASSTGLDVLWTAASLATSIASAALLWLPKARLFFAATKAERRRFMAERIRW